MPRVVIDIPSLGVPALAHAGFVGAPLADLSRFLAVLVADERPDRGEVWWGAINVTAIDRAAARRWRRDTVGIVSARVPLLAALSPRQNALLPSFLSGRAPTLALRRRADALLERAGVTPIRDARSLPAVDRRRIEVVRALLHSPAIVLADDPTRGLPASEARLVEEALRLLASTEGATLLVVTPDAMLASRLDIAFAFSNRLLLPIYRAATVRK